MKLIILLSFCLVSIWASHFPANLGKNNIGTRIINGYPAILGQFPWQVALRVRSASSSWFCGGVIISPDWILTAGHCVSPTSLIADIFAGVININGIDPTASGDEFYQHQQYSGFTLANDIGLIRLIRPLNFTASISAIPLASEEVRPEVEILISGWGLTFTGGSVSNTLNYVYLLTIANQQCEIIYGPGEVHDGMVCAQSDGSPVQSPCNGDSGGPVIINPNTKPTLVGVVSWVSDDGCESPDPSGYTRTIYHRQWIRNITGLDI